MEFCCNEPCGCHIILPTDLFYTALEKTVESSQKPYPHPWAPKTVSMERNREISLWHHAYKHSVWCKLHYIQVMNKEVSELLTNCGRKRFQRKLTHKPDDGCFMFLWSNYGVPLGLTDLQNSGISKPAFGPCRTAKLSHSIRKAHTDKHIITRSEVLKHKTLSVINSHRIAKWHSKPLNLRWDDDLVRHKIIVHAVLLSEILTTHQDF